MTRSRQSFLHGAAVLAFAGLVTRAMALAVQMVMARTMGAQGFGLFQTISPPYFLLVTLATFGLPPAVSKVIAENLAVGDVARARKAWITANAWCAASGLAVVCLAFALSPHLHRFMDPRAIPAFLAMVFRIPIVCLSSVLSGFYMGIQNQTPPALAWIVETTVRAAASVPLMLWMSPWGVRYGALALVIGGGVGELAGYLTMLGAYLLRHRRLLVTPGRSARPAHGVARDLAQVAVPTVLANVLGVIAFAAEPTVMYQAFLEAGVSRREATAMYGAFGMAMELLFMPTVLSGAISSVIVPAISEAKALCDDRLAARRIAQSIHAAMFVALFAAALFIASGEDAATALYRNPTAGHILAYLAPSCLFFYLSDPLFAVLQGLNRAFASTIITFVSSAVRLACIYEFVAAGHQGVRGLASAVAVSGIVSAMLAIFAVRRYHPLDLDLRMSFKMALAAVIAWLPMNGVQHAADQQAPWAQFALCTALGMATYVIAAMYLGLATVDEIARIPVVGRPLARAMRRLPFLGAR
ncbi:putative polysaccharide biosynthesis protein [Alicyclobacillus sendaiensis]|uniref:Polysaccharide biosynthesis protein n=1 Tax=Alicyclobacillus sendaiensis PA2 TaxID=3029425 RepID=A0ABT6XW06_ALISE|nr:polysaccharide biosynthesis protein [Alicyclobacillus sendaiensis]MDI9259170.1 polysaccharide biosynthesis protein [Alicyclobacillus sendaiensis PA2]